jgi:hypothetical protein
MTTPRITPYIVDDIALYVTDSESGMSQASLAKFCGVAESSIKSLLSSMVRGNTSSKALKRFAGYRFYFWVDGENGSKIVKHQICEVVCKYYTFESKHKNLTALSSYRKFANLGLDAWIRDVTANSGTPQTLTPGKSLLQRLIEDELYSV